MSGEANVNNPIDQPQSAGPDIRSADFWTGIITAALQILKLSGALHNQAGEATPTQDSETKASVSEFD